MKNSGIALLAQNPQNPNIKYLASFESKYQVSAKHVRLRIWYLKSLYSDRALRAHNLALEIPNIWNAACKNINISSFDETPMTQNF